MRRMMRGNKQVCIADERLNDFRGRGFVEVDEAGRPTELPEEEKGDRALKKELSTLKEENRELTEQVAELTACLEQPRA